ncbi:hypothetical protein [Persephonella sp.]|jgi:hypothetical protein
MESRVELHKDVIEEKKRKKGLLEAIKEAIKESNPDFPFAGVAVFELGKEHAVALFLDEEENPITDLLIDIKKDIAIKNPKEFRVKIKPEPQGMLHYELYEDGKTYEGKAYLLTPWIPYEEIMR